MDQEQIRLTVAGEIDRFETEEATVSADISHVVVFSGPGTYIAPLKQSNNPWKTWWDQRRLDRGILLVHQVTALRTGKPLNEVGASQVYLDGPILLYNGIPVENEVFREVSNLVHFPIPKQKVVILDTVKYVGEEAPVAIRHTGDQVVSVLDYLYKDHLRRVVALVSSAPHFPRILRYFRENLSWLEPSERPTLRSFPVQSEKSWVVRYATEEMNSLVAYLEKGYLAEEPYPADLGLV